MVTKLSTQEAGVPITENEQEKLMILADMQVLNLADWINPYAYPSDLKEARAKFKERFAFYNLLSMDKDMPVGVNSSTSLVKIHVLWREYMDWCACHPKMLLDPKRYSENLEIARPELEQRIMVWDCYKGNTGVYGPLRSGKSGFVAVHAWHGKEWFGLPVVTYKFRYNDAAFGDYTYLNEANLIEELEKVSKVVEKNKKAYIEWTTGGNKEQTGQLKQEIMDKLNLKGTIIIIDEAHKVVAKDHRTLLSMFWKDISGEWGHYGSQIIYITPDLSKLDRDSILQYLTHEIGVSRNLAIPDTSNINIYHKETGEHKPIILFHRESYYPLWAHNAPIASRSLVTAKDIHDMKKRRDKAAEISKDEEE